ncbi:hypothetical protein A9404_10230 [Halothiobacillus diazotrophicus]|uniref:Uncharacterized protein n=1 Tax=Halothiobacillus diazotrophicus TaxID=1860122 RepID=A0A191ZIM4_9GAMM|nr:hypothetical protein A9404_10230 [Halothiobacillus diazotrophicus]
MIMPPLILTTICAVFMAVFAIAVTLVPVMVPLIMVAPVPTTGPGGRVRPSGPDAQAPQATSQACQNRHTQQT